MPDTPPPPPGESSSRPPSGSGRNLIAPVWHTVMIVLILLTISFLGAAPEQQAANVRYSKILEYCGTFVFELVVVLLIWFWIRRSGVSLHDLIGGRWETVEAFLLDIAIALCFLLVADFALAGIRIALGTVDLKNMHDIAKQKEDIKRIVGRLIPRSQVELGFFIFLSFSAGFFEEVIFRGYLQRQFGALTRSATLGIVTSGVIFGLAHGYQGARMMAAIAIYGMLFGLLAHWRKSLRPCMIAHAVQDSFGGIVLYFLMR